jgi:imidazolonepropionase-like amidohydrolase
MGKKTQKEVVIHAKTLFTDGKRYSDRWIVIKGSSIVEVSEKRRPATYSGIVTPAFVDPHSHIGMFRSGEPGAEQEGNDITHQIQPLNDPIRSIYFDDLAFVDAVDFGVLYSCIMPGSGNLFGGRSKVIRNFASHVGECEVHDFGFKMALGFNPRSTGGWKGDRPNTRMGIYTMLEKRFDEVLAKHEKALIAQERKEIELGRKKLKKSESEIEKRLASREHVLELSSEERALLELLKGKRPVKIHVHKEDDVYYLLHLVKKYKIKVTAEHCGDVFHREVFEELRDAGVPIVYGPVGSHPYKVELRHSFYQNAKLLMESGAMFGLMTDHPVIHASLLRDSLRYFLMYGMSTEEAVHTISGRNAALVGVGDKVGRVAQGMLGSVLVWDRDPLHLGSYPKVVVAEGEIVREQKFS